MIEIIYCLIGLNILTAGLSIWLYLRIKSMKTRPESIELQEFLMDLLSGSALIHVKRIAPSDVVVRARRGRD